MIPDVDVPAWNLVLSVAIAAEGSILFLLGWTRPRPQSRAQTLIGFGVIALFGYLIVDTSAARVLQIARPEVLSDYSFATVLAVLLRFAIFVGLTTFLWHEWKENGRH